MPFHGHSLIPVLHGDRDRVDDYVTVEAGEGGLQPNEFLRSIENDRWKLIHVPNEKYQRGRQKMPYELYEVRSDPMETHNAVSKHPELVELLRKLLAERTADLSPIGNRSQVPAYSKEEIENLRTLGYIR